MIRLHDQGGLPLTRKPEESLRRYKGLHFQQLRSFTETARSGSLAAAAASLGVAQPTVWAQVHALERTFGQKLVESHSRGCRLTAAGQVLVQLASPLVAGFNSLRQTFDETFRSAEVPFRVAASQQILVDDLPEAVTVFRSRYPQVRVILLEHADDEVASVVARGVADVGLTTDMPDDDSRSWLTFEPAYRLDVVLVTPKSHPLVEQRKITLEDLQRYPLVNTLGKSATNDLASTVRQLAGERRHSGAVESMHSAVICRYVEMGYGVGLVVGRPDQERAAGHHRRSLSHLFAPVSVRLVWRKGALMQLHTKALADAVKARLGREFGARRIAAKCRAAQ